MEYFLVAKYSGSEYCKYNSYFLINTVGFIFIFSQINGILTIYFSVPFYIMESRMYVHRESRRFAVFINNTRIMLFLFDSQRALSFSVIINFTARLL